LIVPIINGIEMWSIFETFIWLTLSPRYLLISINLKRYVYTF